MELRDQLVEAYRQLREMRQGYFDRIAELTRLRDHYSAHHRQRINALWDLMLERRRKERPHETSNVDPSGR